jgi:hypothetical protein
VTELSNLSPAPSSSPATRRAALDQPASPSAQTFAALLRQPPRSRDGQRTSPARFDETGLFGARAIASPDARSASASAGAKVSQAEARPGAPAADRSAAPNTTAHKSGAAPLLSEAELSARPASAIEAKIASARAGIAGAAFDARRTPLQVGAPRSRPAMQKTHAPRQASTIFVALRPTQTSVCVFARPGRMAPTDQANLRKAVSTLLAEFGYHDATIEFGATAGETSWRK